MDISFTLSIISILIIDAGIWGYLLIEWIISRRSK